MAAESYCVLRDLKYQDNEKQNTDVLSKNKLDLFLPKDSHTNTPVVVFVHGGGWMRGDRRAYRHYFSIYDTNLLVALAMAYYDAYSNVGKEFAKNGVACAVVSYRLSRLKFPWLIIEILCSFFMSVMTILTPLSLLLLLLSSLVSIQELIQMDLVVIYPLLIVISLLIMWFIVCNYDQWYIISKYEKTWPVIIAVFFTYLLPLPNVTLCLMACLGIFLLQSFAIFHQRRQPAVKHPSHISDVSQSIKWIKDYAVTTRMFDCNRIFLCGHSAGGHLVSLLVLDSSYLERVGLCLSDIKGVISISGVYNLHNLSGGIVEHLFLRPVFGTNKEVWSHASPSLQLSNSLKETLPKDDHKIPFLVINAAHDPLLKHDAQQFVEKMTEYNFPCQYLVVANVNHLSIILKFGWSVGERDSAEEHCLNFIKRTLKRLEQ